MAAVRRMSREESRAQTRDRLIEASRRLFARGGYGGASVDMIAAEAGYSKGAFYGNFASKEAIFLELLALHMAVEAEQLTALVDADRSPDDVLDSIDTWLAQMNGDADWALLAIELQLQARRSAAFATAYDALHAQHRARLGDLLARLFARSGKQLPAPAEELAAALIALAHGLVLQRSSYHSADPAGALIKTVLRSLITAASPI